MNTILISKPISGTIEEHSYNDNGNCIWIKFTRSDYTEWVGSFGSGNSEFSIITETRNRSIIVVNGYAYIINRDSNKLEWEHIEEFNGITGVIVSETYNKIILSNNHEIFIEDDDSFIKFNLNDVDGIELNEINNDIVEGQLFKIYHQDYWIKFKLNIITFKLDYLTNEKIDYWGVLKTRKKQHKSIVIRLISKLGF